MRNGADFYLDTIAVRLDDGDMLLTGGVGGVGNEFDQFLRLKVLGTIGDQDFPAVGALEKLHKITSRLFDIFSIPRKGSFLKPFIPWDIHSEVSKRNTQNEPMALVPA